MAVKLFTISPGETQEFVVTQLAAEEDEEAAVASLVNMAKEKGMVDWIFKPKQKEFDIVSNKEFVRFSMLANPFHSNQAAEVTE